MQHFSFCELLSHVSIVIFENFNSLHDTNTLSHELRVCVCVCVRALSALSERKIDLVHEHVLELSSRVEFIFG